MTLKPDILAQLRRDFPPADVEARAAQLLEASQSPRLQRCIAFAGRGHPDHFDVLCAMVKVDFRDVIMEAEYDQLNVRLYDFNQPIDQAKIVRGRGNDA